MLRIVGGLVDTLVDGSDNCATINRVKNSFGKGAVEFASRTALGLDGIVVLAKFFVRGGVV